MRRSSQARQIAGSLLVALAIAAVAIWVVTDHFGPTSTAKLEALEDREDARAGAREEAAKEREDLREERREAREADGGGTGGNSGPG